MNVMNEIELAGLHFKDFCRSFFIIMYLTFQPSERGNPEEALSEVLSQKSRHLSTISYSLSHSESTQTVTNIAGEYLPTSRIDPLPSCYPSTDGEYYVSNQL